MKHQITDVLIDKLIIFRNSNWDYDLCRRRRAMGRLDMYRSHAISVAAILIFAALVYRSTHVLGFRVACGEALSS